MSPHPQSRASLLALRKQLADESMARQWVYDQMSNKLWMDWRIQRVLASTRCFGECVQSIEGFAAGGKTPGK